MKAINTSENVARSIYDARAHLGKRGLRARGAAFWKRLVHRIRRYSARAEIAKALEERE